MSARSNSPFDPYKVTETGLYLRDNTTADVSTSRHGLTPKLPNDSTKFLNGVGGWAVPTGSSQGSQIFLERHVASNSAQLDFTSFISGTYDKYLIVGESIILASNAVDLQVHFGSGGGPTYDTGSGNTYVWGSLGINSVGGGVNDSGQTGAGRIFQSMANAAGYGFGSFRFIATQLQSTSLRKFLVGDACYASSTPAQIVKTMMVVWTDTATACTALRFIASSGNITSGSITIYGLTNS